MEEEGSLIISLLLTSNEKIKKCKKVGTRKK